ncbi:MAG: hypothetical protein JJE09_05815 [Bacteroidia bacterium]|nr:hypothetical protein [Bacteroidia bacterium]
MTPEFMNDLLLHSTELVDKYKPHAIIDCMVPFKYAQNSLSGLVSLEEDLQRGDINPY